MNHEPALRERWRQIVEAALEYEEEEVAEAAVVPAELTPKSPAFKTAKWPRLMTQASGEGR